MQEETAPPRCYTEAECQTMARRCAVIAVVSLGALVAALFLDKCGPAVGMCLGNALLGWLTWHQASVRIRKGERLPVRQARRTSSPREIILTYLVVLLVSLGSIWLVQRQLLSCLLPGTGFRTHAAAVYLIAALTAGMVNLWGQVFAEHRRSRREFQQASTASVAPAVSGTAPAPLVTQHAAAPHASAHWWTNTDTRDEIQRQQRN